MVAKNSGMDRVRRVLRTGSGNNLDKKTNKHSVQGPITEEKKITFSITIAKFINEYQVNICNSESVRLTGTVLPC